MIIDRGAASEQRDVLLRHLSCLSAATTKRALAATSVGMIVMLVAAPAAAQTVWTGATSTDWTDASNWTNGVPDSSDGTTIASPTALGDSGAVSGATNGVILNGSGSLTVKNGSTLSSSTAAIGAANGSLAAVAVTGSGSHWTTSGQLTVGGTGSGTLNIWSGGTVTALSGVRLGFNAAGTGSVNVNGGSVLETTGLTKGAGGALFTFDNATLRALANTATFTGTLAVNELTIAAGGLTVDTNGFAISAVGFGGAGDLSVMNSGANPGTLTLTGAGTYAGDTRIGINSTLVLTGDHIGTGRLLEIQTALGDDNSVTGRLVVNGNTSGTTDVKVTNIGGVGGVTTTGIRIIEVGGTSAGTFNLSGDIVHNGEQAVIGGAYLYGLYQDVDDGDWHLRNIIDDGPVFQPAAPVIEAYVGAALQAFNTTESLLQRIGNRTMSDGNGLWGRIEAGRVSIAPDSSTGAGYDVTTWQLQAGFDGVLSQSDAGTLVAGVNAQFGIISADISSASGRGSVASNGYGLGATLTWYGDEGFYLDGQGKLTWFDSTLDSETLGTTIVSGNAGFGYALSLEAGQEVALGDNWSVTPQAQLAYSAVDFNEFVSYGSTVALQSGDSLLGRLGLLVDHESEWQDAAGETGSTRLYGIANLTYEFLQGTSTSVGGDTLSSKVDPLWGSIGLGGSVNWAGDALSLYGEVNLGSSLNHLGDSYSLGVTAGIRGKL